MPFMIVGVEVDNQYLFIVHRLLVSVSVLGFVYRLFLPNLFTLYDYRLTILSHNRNRFTKPILGETIFYLFRNSALNRNPFYLEY